MRIASIPHDHPYVLRVHEHTQVELVGDPTGRGDGRTMFQPLWMAEHVDEFDLVHVHFGFENQTVEDMTAWTQVLADARTPLVLTVHDLRNPHLEDNSAQDRLLDVLVPAADGLLTLTHAVASVVSQRWGRHDVEVVPHPHVAPLPTIAAADAGTDGPPRVGLHLKSLRTNFASRAAVEALGRVVRARPDVEVDLRHHHDVDEPMVLSAVERLRRDAGDRCRVLVSDYLPADELESWIASLDALLLPYRWGTHSGWIELCKDLGTSVAAPALAPYVEQGATACFPVPLEQPSAHGMAAALLSALDLPTRPAMATARDAEARHVGAVHQRLYERLVAANPATERVPVPG